jgi:hypothetical protein
VVFRVAFFMNNNMTTYRILSALTLAGLLANGCGQQEVRVYRVPKEQLVQDQPHDHDAPQQAAESSRPRLTWTTPAGWVENPPSQFRVASFQIAGDGGQKADVSVIPLPGGAGGDFSNVNRWRGQVGLEPVSEEEFGKQGEAVTVAGQTGKLYDFDGHASDGVPMRILAAIQHRDGMAWFYKMTGDSALVTKEKPAFIGFLKSAMFASADMPAGHPDISGAGTTAPSTLKNASAGGQPKWAVPVGWKEMPGGQFLAAKFAIAGEDGGQASVNVSTSRGTGGGLAANVNRWRGQLGLQPVSDAELAGMTMPVSSTAGKGVLVEMGNDSTALVAIVVTMADQSWFYKLMGDAAVVAAEKQSFIQFVQGATY